MRIALVSEGDPLDATTWSGTPRGLFDGLSQLGHDVVSVSALPQHRRGQFAKAKIALTRALRGDKLSPQQAVVAARFGPEWGEVPSDTAGRALRGQHVDAVVQAADGFLAPGQRRAMYLDMTTRQDLHYRQFTPGFDLSHLDNARDAGAAAVYRDASALCTATPWAASSLLEDYHIPASSVRAVGIGSRSSYHSPVEHQWEVPRFLFVGTRWERKNGLATLEAFARARQAHSTAELHLVGEHPDISQPGVFLHGFLRRNNEAEQEQLRELYGRATCLVVAGQFEAAGIVYVEAAQRGIPSICGDIGGSPDIVGVGGIVTRSGDVASLASAMTDLCNPRRAQEIGRRGRLRAPLFTWTAVARRILASLGLAEAQEFEQDLMWEKAIEANA